MRFRDKLLKYLIKDIVRYQITFFSMWQDYSNFLNIFSTLITKHCLSEQQTISELCTHLDTLISFSKKKILFLFMLGNS